LVEQESPLSAYSRSRLTAQPATSTTEGTPAFEPSNSDVLELLLGPGPADPQASLLDSQGAGPRVSPLWASELGASPPSCTYNVEEGDYLIAIAQEQGVALEDLKADNPHLARDPANADRSTLPYDFIVPGDSVALPSELCRAEAEEAPQQMAPSIDGFCAPDGTCFEPGFVGDDGSDAREFQERKEREGVLRSILECSKGPAECSQELVNKGVDELASDADKEDATLWDSVWGARKQVMEWVAPIFSGPIGIVTGAAGSTDASDGVTNDEHGRTVWTDPNTGEVVVLNQGDPISS
jgi:hypothetical protein